MRPYDNHVPVEFFILDVSVSLVKDNVNNLKFFGREMIVPIDNCSFKKRKSY